MYVSNIQLIKNDITYEKTIIYSSIGIVPFVWQLF